MSSEFTKRIECLKPGDKLWQLRYWEGHPWKNNGRCERQLAHVKIKKVNPKSLTLVYWEWKIKKDEIGFEWFLTKKEAYEHALECHKESLEAPLERVNDLQKEIKYLERKIKEELKEE